MYTNIKEIYAIILNGFSAALFMRMSQFPSIRFWEDEEEERMAEWPGRALPLDTRGAGDVTTMETGRGEDDTFLRKVDVHECRRVKSGGGGGDGVVLCWSPSKRHSAGQSNGDGGFLLGVHDSFGVGEADGNTSNGDGVDSGV